MRGLDQQLRISCYVIMSRENKGLNFEHKMANLVNE